MQETTMQGSEFPPELEHLRANLSVLISRAMSGAHALSQRAQGCEFGDERELTAFMGDQARAHFAMVWQRRIEALAKDTAGRSLNQRLGQELRTAATNTTSIYEVYVIELVHDGLQLALAMEQS